MWMWRKSSIAELVYRSFGLEKKTLWPLCAMPGIKKDLFCCILSGFLRCCCCKRRRNQHVLIGPYRQIVIYVGLLLTNISCIQSLFIEVFKTVVTLFL